MQNGAIAHSYRSQPHNSFHLVSTGSTQGGYPGSGVPHCALKNPYYTPFVHPPGHPTPFDTNGYPVFNTPPSSGTSRQSPSGLGGSRHVPVRPGSMGMYACGPPSGSPQAAQLCAPAHQYGMLSSSDASTHGMNALPQVIPESSSESMYEMMNSNGLSPGVQLTLPPLKATAGASSSGSAPIVNAKDSLDRQQQKTRALDGAKKKSWAAEEAMYASYDSLRDSTSIIHHTMKPPTKAPPDSSGEIEKKQDYVNKQLDSLLGKEVLGGLVVLSGAKNRLNGGALCSPLIHACDPELCDLLWGTVSLLYAVRECTGRPYYAVCLIHVAHERSCEHGWSRRTIDEAWFIVVDGASDDERSVMCWISECELPQSPETSSSMSRMPRWRFQGLLSQW